MNSKDSAAFMMEKGKLLNETVMAYESKFFDEHKGTFVGDVINLKTEKEAKGFLNNLVKPDYNWNDKEEYEQRLVDLIERKFL
mgnify:CR=1 FL=1